MKKITVLKELTVLMTVGGMAALLAATTFAANANSPWAIYNATGMHVGEQSGDTWKTLPDQSGNGHDITYCMGTSATAAADPDRGHAVIYNDGWGNAGFKLSVDGTFTTAFSGSRTVAMWFKRYPTDDHYGAKNDDKLYLVYNFYGLSAHVYKGINEIQLEVNGESVGTGVSFTRDCWMHLAFTLEAVGDGTAIVTLYVDAVPRRKLALPTMPTPISGADFSIASHKVGSVHTPWSYMDDLRLYDGALSAAQVREVSGVVENEYYLRYGAASITNLTATAAQSVWDLSGSGHHGMTGSTVDYVTVATNDLLRGSVIELTGWGASYIKTSVASRPAMTLTAWVKPDVKSYNYGETKTLPNTLVTNFCGVSIWNLQAEERYHCTVGSQDIDNNAQLRRGEWQQIAVTIADTGLTSGGNFLCDVAFYLDGSPVGEVKNVEMSYGDWEMWMGDSDYNNRRGCFWCLLDDVRIYNRTLTAAEVAASYANTSGRRVAPIAHFPMDVINENGGVRTTPNLINANYPMRLGALVETADGVEGAGSLYFNAPSNVNETIESWGTYTNGAFYRLGGDIAISMWAKTSRFQYTKNGERFFDVKLSTSSSTVQQRTSISSGGIYKGSSQIGSVAMPRMEEWVHLTYVFSESHSGATHTTTLKTYYNGEYSKSITIGTDLKYGFGLPDCVWTLMSEQTHTRPSRGYLDDVRIFAGKITDADVKAIYRGPAVPDAGADFAVKGETAKLSGQLSPFPYASAASGFAGESEWALVSAPVGGEAAAIANPKALTTEVTLPVAGEYEFALKSMCLGFENRDTVKVTRNDALSPVGTTATASVKAATGFCAIVQVTGAAAGTRLRWYEQSGAGGAFFKDDAAAETLVTFSAAGSYVLACELSDGVGKSILELPITVSGSDASLAAQLDRSLEAWWNFTTNATDATFTYDHTGVYGMKNGRLNYDYGRSPVPGVGGLYGIQNGWNSSAQFGAEIFAGFNGEYQYNINGLTEWHTVSLWFYHLGDDQVPDATARIVNNGAIVSANAVRYLYYTPYQGTSTDFHLKQLDAGKTKWYNVYFNGPTKNLTNRWVHVVLQMKQTGDNIGPELWVDGEKLTIDTSRSETIPSCVDRPKEEQHQYWFLGLRFNELKDTADNQYGHIPGYLDEVRIYNRQLSEAEIRCLHDYPAGPQVALAPSVMIPLSTVKMVKRQSAEINAAAYAADTAAELTYEWSVLSGDSEAVQLSSATVLAPTVMVTKVGTYQLQLKVADGTRVTYSEPIAVEITRPGMVIFLE